MRKKYLAAAVVFGLAALICGGIGISKYLQEKNAGQEYEEVKNEVVKEETEEQPVAETADVQTEQQEASTVEIPIDFEELQSRNPDAYAWIKVPGTAVDYPILQSGTDNSYYLSHTIDNEEKPEGSIFTENYNTKTFEDPNTVIYGHDMKNGSMFQSLHNYMDRSFFDENREVLIYLPDQILHYKIFAAYIYDNRHILQSFDFGNKEIFQAYLDNIFSMRDMNSFVDTSMDITSEDKIITLSTCYAGISTQRYLVQAVLISIEK